VNPRVVNVPSAYDGLTLVLSFVLPPKTKEYGAIENAMGKVIAVMVFGLNEPYCNSILPGRNVHPPFRFAT
jgi:hypothetical protein